jgi:hypothetical protein
MPEQKFPASHQKFRLKTTSRLPWKKGIAPPNFHNKSFENYSQLDVQEKQKTSPCPNRL